MKNSVLTFLIASIIFTGCSTSMKIPMTSTVNDFVIMGTKTNSKSKVNFIYNSKVKDGITYLLSNDRKDTSKHLEIGHTESTTLNNMVKQYIDAKFTDKDSSGDVVIKVSLEDFYLEQNALDGSGKTTMVALFGGELTFNMAAKVKVSLHVEKEGKTYDKTLIGSSEETHVAGIGTGTQTSNIYKGKDSPEFVHAKNINAANNKILMQMNAYLDEIGL